MWSMRTIFIFRQLLWNVTQYNLYLYAYRVCGRLSQILFTSGFNYFESRISTFPLAGHGFHNWQNWVYLYAILHSHQVFRNTKSLFVSEPRRYLWDVDKLFFFFFFSGFVTHFLLPGDLFLMNCPDSEGISQYSW